MVWRSQRRLVGELAGDVPDAAGAPDVLGVDPTHPSSSTCYQQFQATKQQTNSILFYGMTI